MAATVPQDRLAGFRGAVWFGANKILDIFDWTLEIQQEVAMAAIKGEVHNTYAAGGVTSRVTAQRFATDVDTNLAATPNNEQGGSVFGQNLANNKPAAGNSPAWTGKTVTFTLWTVDQSTAPVQGFKITGEGFITRVNQNNPRGSVTEAFELQCTILPSFAN